MTYLKVKRAVDIFLALIFLIVFSPLYIAIIIAIKIDTRGPVIFKQERYGKGKKPFGLLKFRTMRIDAPKNSPTCRLKNPDKYITRTGRFLRKNSLDELPQVWNILMGKMSFVGPRPVVINELDLIQERDRYGANSIRPGLTGWAQVNGRDELTAAAKARVDGEYVKRMNFLNDMACLVRTIPVVLKRDGYVEGARGVVERREAAVEKVDLF